MTTAFAIMSEAPRQSSNGAQSTAVKQFVAEQSRRSRRNGAAVKLGTSRIGAGDTHERRNIRLGVVNDCGLENFSFDANCEVKSGGVSTSSIAATVLGRG